MTERVNTAEDRPAGKFANRRMVRIVLFQLLYQEELNPGSLEHHAESYIAKELPRHDPLRQFASRLLQKTIDHREAIDTQLSALSQNWTLARMSPTDRSILRLATAEILYTDTPKAVAINEAIELAKTFGTKDSAPFVNGILDHLAVAQQCHTPGMTLLEIILSLAILGGSVAVIGELARVSFQDARQARNLVQAELLAESILAKVRLGIMEMEPVFDAPVSAFVNRSDTIADTHALSEGNISDVLWVYSLEVLDLDDYLIEIAVTVRQNIADERRSAVCRLVRWLAIEPEEEEQAAY